MGWTFSRERGVTGLDMVLRDYPGIIRHALVGQVLYAALEDKAHEKVCACVFLLDGPGYKAIWEECEPYYYSCPAEILDMLTPTKSEWANNWRARCRQNATAKRKG